MRTDDQTRDDRRRAAGPAQRGRDRQHVEGRGRAGGASSTRGGGCWDVSDDEAGRRSSRRCARGWARRPAKGRWRSSRASTAAPGVRAPAAATRILSRGQGDANRTTYWCPGCRSERTTARAPALRRVGHKGADLIAPGQHARELRRRAARRRRHDRVRRAARARRRGRLLLAHDYEDAARRTRTRSRRAWPTSRSQPFAGVELDVDLKLPGYELRVLQALRRARDARAVADLDASMRESLEVIRAAEPGVRLGWSVPKRQARPVPLAARRAAGAGRAAASSGAVFPSRAAPAISAGRCDAMMAHWRLVTAAARAPRCRTPAASSTCGRSTSWRGCRARGARRDRRDHKRPPAVRGAHRVTPAGQRIVQVAAVNPCGSPKSASR